MVTHTVDLLLHIGNFRSYEFMFTGVYRLKITCFYPNGSKVIPYLTKTGESLFTENVADFFEAYKGGCDLDNRFFESSSFFIDYGDVFKELNQLCVFRLLLKDDPSKQTIKIKIELMMLKTPDSKKTKKEAPEAEEFVTIANGSVLADNVFFGMNKYIPLVFTDYHFCYVETFLHSFFVRIIYLFRYRSR